VALDRAYSLLEIKAVDDDQRIIEGIATTVSPDRMEDEVESGGAVFRRNADGSPDVPIKWQHGRDPKVGDVGVGHLLSAKVLADKIRVRIKFASDDQPGILKDVLDYVWRAIKLRLVKGLSIGFRSLESEPIKGTMGIRFKRWEWLELSAVTIPANAEASILAVKSAASGHMKSPGASGTSIRYQKPKEGAVFDTESNIAGLEAAREQKAKQLSDLAERVTKEGRTKNESEQQEHDELVAEVKSLDREIVDAKELQAIMGKAQPVNGNGTKAAGESRDTRVVVRHPAKPEAGIEFAQFVMCQAAARGDTTKALQLMQRHYPHNRAVETLKAADQAGMRTDKFIEMVGKGAVAGGTTAGTYWASPLVAYNQFSGDFVEYLRPRTIIGQFGQNGVPALRQIPFNVHIRGQTSGGTGYWVGQGAAKPATYFNFSDTSHAWYKLAAISVITEELIRFSDPAAERLVRDGLADCLVERMDTDFVDPTKEIAANVSPASITNGATAIPSTGTDGDGVRTDLQLLLAEGIAANVPLTGAVFITTPSIALGLSLMTNTMGGREFPNISVNGGRLEGFPVIVSNYVSEGLFILAYASEIWLSDDGTVTVDASREAAIEMVDSSSQTAATGTGAALVSMYQTDSVALRAHRFINWSKRRTTACAYLNDVDWGGAVS
jgi:HK97 family phage major capsid protein